jgi:hypothetical protein
MLDVRSFGAVGDKVADDTAAILACIASAKAQVAANKAPAVVYLPAGDYRFTGTLTLGHKIAMVGEGRWSSRLWLDASLGAGVPAIRLDDPAVSSFQHGNGIRGIGLNCQGKAEVGVYAANVNEGGGLSDCMVLDWTLYGFHAGGITCLNYLINDCEIYSTRGDTPGKIAVYIDRGNHTLGINHVTTQCHLNGGTGVSAGSVGIMYAPGSTAGSDADVNSALITNCHFEACEDGVQVYQGRAKIINCDGWTDVANTVHWTNRGYGSCEVVSCRNTGGVPVKDSTARAKARSANAADPLRLYVEEPIGGVANLYYTDPYYPQAAGKNRTILTMTGTPNASGLITIPHTLGYSPLFVFPNCDAGPGANAGKRVTVHSRSATAIVLQVFDALGAVSKAGAIRVWVDVAL